MRQLLCNSNGALVARMPKPIVEAGMVLVRVRYSLISVGTEIAPLRASVGLQEGDTPFERAIGYSKQAHTYLNKAIRDPQKALTRIKKETKRALEKIRPQKHLTTAVFPKLSLQDFTWTRCNAVDFKIEKETLDLTTDDSQASYQVMSQPIGIPDGYVPILTIQGHIHQGAINVGFLNDQRDAWLGSRTYQEGSLDDSLIVKVGDSKQVTLVLANVAGHSSSRLSLHHIEIEMVPPTENGLPRSELDDQGWNIGYSAAGEVLAVGEDITDLVPGDLVACAGAGQANHADYICVRRRLVCSVPTGCSTKLAATTTVGSIALQGVRRASPQLGDCIAVLGLGLIGQMTAQMLQANGCTVVGFDLEEKRVERALELGMDYGETSEDMFKSIIRDVTRGWGVDQTLITAATKSDTVVNLAMEITRRKGQVVLVGDVGLNIDRPTFYRKEIDLLMSTSYGPGRYDHTYEHDGIDYPFPYVRWTMNRNMGAFLEMIAKDKLNIEKLIDEVIDIDQAPNVYQRLAHAKKDLPLGVLIHYPDDQCEISDTKTDTSLRIRGHRKISEKDWTYALLGIGAFGTSMLVPLFEKPSGKFVLKAVVSRDATRGGNYARTMRAETFSTYLTDVLGDSEIDLVVIATRHCWHSEQVVECLKAQKHVFVEKPLALTWNQLDQVVAAYDSLDSPPLLMVGFNRRFSPAIQTLKKIVDQRRSSLMIHYRLNGGYIPPDSWIQGLEGGGRNLGEACHMYDVFRFLVGKSVTNIDAQAINPQGLPYQRNDNFCATLSYEDGSVANLVYTALGPKEGLPKERVEIFCDGHAYVIDNYKALTQCKNGKILWESAQVDKGHQEEIARFSDAIIQNNESPIPFAEIVETSAVALQVEDLIQGRMIDNDDES